MFRCPWCRVNSKDWEGRIPFLYSVFVKSGSSPQSFSRWIENFRGDIRPEDDIADYLHECFGIKVTSLEKEADAVNSHLRLAVQEAWQSAHDKRRQRFSRSSDPMLAVRLA